MIFRLLLTFGGFVFGAWSEVGYAIGLEAGVGQLTTYETYEEEDRPKADGSSSRWQVNLGLTVNLFTVGLFQIVDFRRETAADVDTTELRGVYSRIGKQTFFDVGYGASESKFRKSQGWYAGIGHSIKYGIFASMLLMYRPGGRPALLYAPFFGLRWRS